MAITSAWTTTIPTAKLPTGATVPTVAELEGTVSKENFAIELSPAATYDNAVEATGFAAVGAGVKTSIDAGFIPDTLGLDATATITARIVITKVRRGWDNIPYDSNDEFADAEQYAAATEIFRVWGYVEWEVAV